MIPLTTATPRKVVSIVVDFANASTVVQFSAAVFLVLLGSNTPRRVSAVLSAEPAIMVAIR
jgi:aromatic ring-opening dioxygenase LigB subunit